MPPQARPRAPKKTLSPTGSTVSARRESLTFAYGGLAYGLVDDADNRPQTHCPKGKILAGPLRGLARENPTRLRRARRAPPRARTPLASPKKRLSPTGSTVSGRRESPTFAYGSLAYGLMDDADFVRRVLPTSILSPKRLLEPRNNRMQKTGEALKTLSGF